MVLLLVALGRVYELWASWRDAQSYPPPGELVSVASHRFHLNCIGTGAPTVVFDAGAGGTSMDWNSVQRQLATDTRTCAYDRAGLGWSDPGPRPRTSERIVGELRTLLHNAGVEPPFILVGHSFGGLNMQLFAALYPNEVAGLVLVDSIHADFYQRMPSELRTTAASQLRMLSIAKASAAIGASRLFLPPIATQNLPTPLQLAANARGVRASAYSTVLEEARVFDLSSKQVRTNRQLLSGTPLTVLSRSLPEAWPPGVSPHIAEQIWLELQRDLAASSPNSKHVIVKDAGHFIHIDQPKVVVAAIKELVETARQQVRES